jgi:hypothetical protein
MIRFDDEQEDIGRQKEGNRGENGDAGVKGLKPDRKALHEIRVIRVLTWSASPDAGMTGKTFSSHNTTGRQER